MDLIDALLTSPTHAAAVDRAPGSAALASIRSDLAPTMYATSNDISRAMSDADSGVTTGIVLTMRVENSLETFHVLVQSEDYQRFAKLVRNRPTVPALHARRVGIQSNYCPATPGQLVEPAVFDLETGAGAGYPGGPDPKAVYMAVGPTEAVAVPPEVLPWLRAFAAGQQAIAAR